MIDPKELRIGNLVKKENGNICIIQSISQIEAHLFNVDRNLPDHISFVEGRDGVAMFLLGVPLTEELLWRFGFEQIHTTFYEIDNYEICLADFSFSIKAKYDPGDQSSIELCKTEYVHKLQNVFFELKNKELILK